MKYYLAIDVGASSGRHTVGWEEDGTLRTKEVFRFPNGVTSSGDSLTWDLDALVSEVKKGIDEAIKAFPGIVSLSVDTWGCDYVLTEKDREILPAFAYRDRRTAEAVEKVNEILPFSEMYKKTGIQFQPFNTVYQLYADKLSGRLERASDFLMIPEYIMYKLCGIKSHEYTVATTTGLVGACSGEYDKTLIDSLGLPKRLFCDLSRPGKAIGEYKGIKVVLCCTHDTASAVEGIPETSGQPYISSGTWSLLGIKTAKPVITPEGEKANWSNEGGNGYYRLQKNIMGLWLVNRLRDELCPEAPFGEIEKLAEGSVFDLTVDANSPDFLSPKSMKDAFDAFLIKKPETPGDYFRCAYRSLAFSYKEAIEELENIACRRFDSVYIVGGGAKNAFLNRMTCDITGKKTVALPIEATTLGNLKIQTEAEK